MDAHDFRRKHLRELYAEYGTWEKLSGAVNSPATHLRNIAETKTGKPNLGAALARKIEAALGKPRGWMDRDDDAPPTRPIETEALLVDFEALPDGLKEHVVMKVAQLRRYVESLPDFLLVGLAPPKDPVRHREWERQIEADMLTRLSPNNGNTRPAADY